MNNFTTTVLIALIARGLLTLVGLTFAFMGFWLFKLGYFQRGGEIRAKFGKRYLLLKQVAPGVFFAVLGSATICVGYRKIDVSTTAPSPKTACPSSTMTSGDKSVAPAPPITPLIPPGASGAGGIAPCEEKDEFHGKNFKIKLAPRSGVEVAVEKTRIRNKRTPPHDEEVAASNKQKTEEAKKQQAKETETGDASNRQKTEEANKQQSKETEIASNGKKASASDNTTEAKKDGAVAGVEPLIQFSRSIYFPTDRPHSLKNGAALLPSEREVLKSLADSFKAYLTTVPDAHLVLRGHADVRGPASYNQALSERRVELAKRFLVEQGIPEANLDTQAFGKEQELTEDQVKQLLDQNPLLTPEEKQKALAEIQTIALANNRRVDIELSTTGQESARLYPFKAPDYKALVDRGKPVEASPVVPAAEKEKIKN